GCVLDRPDWMEHAMERAEGDIPFQVDDQGLSNEAAPHYAQFNYVLFQAIDETAARITGRWRTWRFWVPGAFWTDRTGWSMPWSAPKEIFPSRWTTRASVT
ncbi:hypothetical protein EDM40_15175, partial [Staphylococcus aureus]